MIDTNILSNHSINQSFHLKKYGYTLDRVLNNQNRWDTKIVYSIFDRDLRHCVSTTYVKEHDYLKLLEATTFLECKGKLSPKIIALYPEERTGICDYIGMFLQDYLLDNPQEISSSMSAVFDYLRDLNEINKQKRRFIIPSIVEALLDLSKELGTDFDFMPRSKEILPQLRDSGIKFSYGYGIEDPHIWNFRVTDSSANIQAFTTDFDYFSDLLNCYWEFGYLYATFRWLRRTSFSTTEVAEEHILYLVQDKDLKSEFMFWLGVLSSYCGYKDSLRSFIKGEGLHELEKEYEIINALDEKVTSLAKKLLNRKEKVLKWRQELNRSHWKTINLLDVAGSGMIGGGN